MSHIAIAERPAEAPVSPEPSAPAVCSDMPGNPLGFWTALLTSVCALAALAVRITTPARSGPNCLNDCITYPYTDVAAFVPRDYLWMYPASFVAALFVVLVSCIHQAAPETRQRFSLIGVAFAIVAATVLLADYLIQLTVVQPSLLNGETAALSLLSECNPHGVFIALEDLGYLSPWVSPSSSSVSYSTAGAGWTADCAGSLSAVGLPPSPPWSRWRWSTEQTSSTGLKWPASALTGWSSSSLVHLRNLDATAVLAEPGFASRRRDELGPRQCASR